MRRLNFLLPCFLWLCWLSGFSQLKPLDSLSAALAKSHSDIDRVRLFNALAETSQSNPKKMLEISNRALSLAKKIKFTEAEGSAYLNIGNANVILGNYPEALRNFSSAQSVFEKELESNPNKEVKRGLARAYGSIGIVFSEQSNYSRALQYHLKALRIYEALGNKGKCAQIYNNIGVVYQAQGDHFRALEYFTKCLKLQEKIGDPTVGITITNIGNIYLAQENYDKALEHYKKAKLVFDHYPNPRGLGELYNNLGQYYQKNGNTVAALKNYNDALATFESIGDQFGASDTYALIGEVYFHEGDLAKALSNTEKSLALGRSLGVWERIRESEKMLSEIYQKLNKPDAALEHYKQFAIASDSIGNYENIRNSVRAEMNFEFDKKQALQKEEQEKKEIVYAEQAKRHKMQIFFVSLFILLAFGIVFLIYSRRHLKKTLTLQKELAEYEQKALHLQMNPHFVFNCLGSISSFIVQNGTDSAIKYLSKFSKLMRLTLEYSKESLIPIDREIESLQNYLELEQLRFDNAFDFIIRKSNAIDDDVALPPLLLQPFVENAIIHGLIPKKEKGRIEVDFTLDGESLLCTITDTGIGFETSQALKKELVNVHKSMALDITQKRLEMIEAATATKAHVDINETKDGDGNVSGTKVVLHLPVQYLKN